MAHAHIIRVMEGFLGIARGSASNASKADREVVALHIYCISVLAEPHRHENVQDGRRVNSIRSGIGMGG